MSGGQRQRIAIAIARALLKQAPILIMDEATASLDARAEHAILQLLAGPLLGKTVLVIAHSRHTMTQLDHILVFASGRIREQGTHEVLLAKNGAYAKLFAAKAK